MSIRRVPLTLVLASLLLPARVVFADPSTPDGGVDAGAPASPTDEIPAVTPLTFCDDLARSIQGRKVEEQKLADERGSLEKLTADIAKARAALKAETEHLEQLLKQADARKAADGSFAGSSGPDTAEEEPHADVVAKSMRGLKPEQAAAVVKKLDRNLAARVLALMKPQDASAMLGRLEPAEAAELLTDAARDKGP